MKLHRRPRRAAVAVLLLLPASGAAHAHGLGQRYDLPVPLWLYLMAAAAAVVASFAFVLGFRPGAHGARYRAPARARRYLPHALIALARSLFVALLALVVAAGLLGHQSPFKNISPALVWVLWWVGMPLICAVFGDVWRLVNPFKAIYSAAAALVGRHGRRPLLPYPSWLGAWPAVALLLLFAWCELVAPARDVPANIAFGVLAYTAFTCTGCYLFGPRVWSRSGDAFAVMFALLGRFAPVQFVRGGSRWAWRLRPWGVGLLSPRPLPPSIVAFALTMLATVSADGFMETPAWAAVLDAFGKASGRTGLLIREFTLPTALVILAPLIFAAGYLGVIRLMRSITAGSTGAADGLAGRFVLTLVPIAIGYHVAHYFSYLLIAGQLIIPLASDPFGFGWDLFGTRLYRLDIGIVDARTTWFVAVGAIVAGHVVATWLSHETAVGCFRDQAGVRRSQLPMIVLMVGYTVLSLWILAQPITR